ncbi:MAG: hypothetical protein IMF07_03290, partial [Proteobacteria bacterium]|nr:hypothetical protein [Pseudomonadota bacterium]
AKGLDFSLGGKLEFEYVDNKAEGKNGHFDLDVVELYPKAVTKSGIIFKAEIVGDQDKTIIEEAHVTFPDLLPGKTWLKIGKEDRFIKRSRKTETYPIAGTQFWRDDVEGIWLHGGTGGLYWDVSFTNSYALSTKSTTEETITDATATKDIVVLHDNRANGDGDSKKEAGIGLGYKYKTDSHDMDLRVFYYDGKVGGTTGVADLAINPTDDRDMLGGRISCIHGKFTLVAEYIDASYGNFDTSVWYVEPSFKNSVEGFKYLKGYELVLRYNESDPDVGKDPLKPLTWGLKQTTIAFIALLDKTVKFKLEYNIVDESNGGAEVDNNEVVAQLQFKF